MDSYLLLRRSQEEIAMLTDDIQNIIGFYEKKMSFIVQGMDETVSDTPYHRGVKSLLHVLYRNVSLLLQEAKQTFAHMQEVDDPDVYYSDSDCDNSCNSSSDEDI